MRCLTRFMKADSAARLNAKCRKAFQKEKERTISVRTIQRCIKKRQANKKTRPAFFIDHEAIYEKRYLRPAEFGRRFYRRYLDETVGAITTFQESESLETSLKKLITKLGVFLIFSFGKGNPLGIF